MDISTKAQNKPDFCGFSDALTDVMGLPIFSRSRADCRRLLSERAAAPQKHPLLIFTPGIEMLLASRRSPAWHRLLSKADLLLPDGVGAQILSRFRIKERIPGIETGEFLLSLAAAHALRVFLLGGRRGVAVRAAKRMQAQHRGLCIVGTHHGYFSPDSEEEHRVSELIHSAAPDILIVCMGFPRQEEFLLRYRDHFPSLRIGIALGGSLDVWSGDLRRAPRLLRACGLEWLWRIAREPKRIPRLIKNLLPFPRGKD